MKKITLLFWCLFSAIAWAQPGAIDTTFNVGGTGPDLVTYATINQPDGKILIAGAFDNYNGVPRSGIARINVDGSLDTSFDPGSGLALSTEYINCITLQSDGKILIGGVFANFNGTARANIARLNQDGSVDTSFNPGTGANDRVVTIALQSTGQILVGGLYTNFNGTTTRLVRLNSNGTTDTTFNAGGTGPNLYVWTISVLPDDKIYIGGGFSSYNGANSNHLLRLNANGSRDTSYTASRFTNNAVLTHAVQPDGKIIIGGYFTNYGGASNPRSRIARINYDGTLDTSFVVGTGLDNYAMNILRLPNGKIVVVGAFLNYNGTGASRIVRLNNDGSVDTSFVTGTGLTGITYVASFQPDGKLLLPSESLSYNGNTSQPNLTKISAYPANTIAITSLSATAPYCVEQAFDVNFSADGYYAVGNTFTAQLSDASGSFAAPVAIGSTNAVSGGTIPVTIPLETPQGNGYRLRIVSSNLPFTSADNGADLAIVAPATFYEDADGDGYGNPSVSQQACTAPTGYVANDSDCNDDEPAAYSGSPEILYDGIDNNCDGNLDEGFQITTALLPSACNTTLSSINSLVGITTLAPYSTITRFRIRATNGAQVQTIETNVPHFNMTQFASYAYATTYTIAVELQRNGVWLGYYGPSCAVSTPAVLAPGGAASISPTQCNTTLARVNTLIATTSLAGVTEYRFRVTNLTDPSEPNAVQTLERSLNWFTLQMLTRYNYGTTYRIEVAVKSTGDFGGYGTPCELSSPAVPSLTNCSGTVSAMNTFVTTTSLPSVTQYRFQVVRASDNATTTIDRSLPYFMFSAVPVDVFTAGATYNVRVAVMTSGIWSPFGGSCTITAPGGMAKPSSVSDVATADHRFDAMAFPNPFNTDFEVAVLSSSAAQIHVKVYDMLGRLMESATVDADAVQKVGADFPSGVYNVIVNQGETMRALRVIKR